MAKLTTISAIGTPRSIFTKDGTGTYAMHECPVCHEKTLRWRALGHFPALVFGCINCRYTEGPPIERVVEDGCRKITEVTDEWESSILKESQEWCPGHPGCSCMLRYK